MQDSSRDLADLLRMRTENTAARIVPRQNTEKETASRHMLSQKIDRRRRFARLADVTPSPVSGPSPTLAALLARLLLLKSADRQVINSFHFQVPPNRRLNCI
jgi:hypothetical protein